VVRIYADVLFAMFGPGMPYLIKGLGCTLIGRHEQRIKVFLEGSVIWGDRVRRLTGTRIVRFGQIDCPESGHLILLNHVNEMDFAFDSLVVHKAYLANEAIKRTLFAYWWMRGMGSQVFDHRQARSIPASVRGLVAGLARHSYIVYPEGGNSYGEQIRPLRKGMLKVAFDNRIPVYVVLKSGMAAFQERQRDNVIGYTGLGTVQPADFPTWTAFRDHIHALMSSEKPLLDERVRMESQAATAVTAFQTASG
ncbi:MAG TPA: 1-acyl-sn-glycerol-3-phosphate acyltransferase, partial [Thermoanaerobaculia bacterium]|nr:1-acyl-sn-glycerol-3-phosphate acyltransferase [Thermoanaerobaculia bacterium]